MSAVISRVLRHFGGRMKAFFITRIDQWMKPAAVPEGRRTGEIEAERYLRRKLAGNYNFRISVKN